MGLALLVARLLLAAVFAVAGLTKLADLDGSRQAVRDFGVPAVLASPLGTLLPLAELAVAIALIPPASAWWGAIGAVALLFLFIAGIGYNLSRGRRPECHCFGQLHSAPAGWPTLLRNVALVAIAGVIVGFGRVNAGPSILSWLGTAQRIDLLIGGLVVVLLAALFWVLIQMLRQNGRLLLRLEAVEAELTVTQLAVSGTASPHTLPGLPVGTLAPSFHIPDLNGDMRTLDELRAKGNPILLLFANPDCGPCKALLPEVGRWQRRFKSRLTLAVISRGTPEANREVTRHAVTDILLQQGHEVADTYQEDATPGAVLVLPDGTIGSPLAEGAAAIHALVARAVNLPVLRAPQPATPMSGYGTVAPDAPSQSVGPKVGEPAPAFMVPGLDS